MMSMPTSFILIGGLNLVALGDNVEQSDAAARNDALFDSCARCLQRVLDAGLLLLEPGLGCSTDLEHCHAAGELGEALLELLAVEVGLGAIELGLDLGDAVLNILLIARAVDDERIFCDSLTVFAVPSMSMVTSASVIPRSLETTVAPVTAAMSSRMRLWLIAEAGGLDGNAVEGAAQLVEQDGGKCFASTSSATRNSGRPVLMIDSSSETISWMLVTFWSVSRMNGSLRFASIFSASVAMYGEM